MAYSKDIETLQQTIQALRDIKEMLYATEQHVLDVEKTVCAIDESLPDEAHTRALPAGAEKEQILHLYDLTDEAFRLIDEILGPPEDEYSGAAYSPEARGNAKSEISLDEIIHKMSSGGGKHHAS